MMKNLFKLENDQSTNRLLITMKKNNLCKQDNNQSAKQVSNTMQVGSIVACSLTKNKHSLRSLPNTHNSHYRTPFFPVHPSGVNTTRF